MYERSPYDGPHLVRPGEEGWETRGRAKGEQEEKALPPPKWLVARYFLRRA